MAVWEGRSFSLVLCYLGRHPWCGLGYFLPGEVCGSSREHDSLSLCPLCPCINHPKTPRGHLTSSQPSHLPNSRDGFLLAKPRRCHACSHHRAFAHALLAAWDCQPPGGTWWLKSHLRAVPPSPSLSVPSLIALDPSVFTTVMILLTHAHFGIVVSLLP